MVRRVWRSLLARWQPRLGLPLGSGVVRLEWAVEEAAVGSDG